MIVEQSHSYRTVVMNLWLNEEQIIELTGYKTKCKQKKALAEMGIPFRSRPADGYPLVDSSLFQQGISDLTRKRKRREPRMDLIQ